MLATISQRFRSRRRVVVTAVLLLLILDAGRSVYARIGYAQPSGPWQSAPYQSMAWPPSDNLPQGVELGREIYILHCAVCHGLDGKGNGPAAPSMIPRPADFTLGVYKYKSTSVGQLPTDRDLYDTVADGLQASAMPYWHDLLSDEEIKAVVAYIKNFSPLFNKPAVDPIGVPPRGTPDAESIARGKQLFTSIGCIGCHGPELRGGIVLNDGRGYPVITRDLTAPWTFRGGSEPEEIWMRITTGLSPSPMVAHEGSLTAEERWDLVNYLLSNSRTPPWEPGGTLDGPGFQEDPVKRGRYLVRFEMCGLCHTQVSADLRYSGDEYYLAGGMGIQAYPQGVFVSRNLTSDLDTGIGDWTAEEIASAIRNGRTPSRNLNLWGMPWMVLHSFNQEDAVAIGSYLQSLPPVNNQIPLPLRYGVVESLVMKTLSSNGFPPIGDPQKLVYVDGNYGRLDPGLLPRHWPQSLLIAAQWLVSSLGVVGFVLATPPERRRPHEAKGWLKAGLVFLGLLILWGLGWVLVNTPILPFIPPEQINTAVTSTIHLPDPDSFDSPETAALAERGRYLFTVTSCAFCHGNDGAGGLKISSRDAIGTIWVRNISTDKETGIGEWSDAEIARAIRSGVSVNGEALHWQGMIWDHLSNLDEEDLRAIIVYLRTLPPVRNVVAVPVRPSLDDCAEYSFFLVPTNKPGCTP